MIGFRPELWAQLAPVLGVETGRAAQKPVDLVPLSSSSSVRYDPTCPVIPVIMARLSFTSLIIYRKHHKDVLVTQQPIAGQHPVAAGVTAGSCPGSHWIVTEALPRLKPTRYRQRPGHHSYEPPRDGLGRSRRGSLSAMLPPRTMSRSWRPGRPAGPCPQLPQLDVPLHALLDHERAAIIKLTEEWGEIDRSHRKLAHRGSRLGVVHVRESTAGRVLTRGHRAAGS